MLNFFRSQKSKPKSTGRKEIFMLGDYTFSIDKSQSTIDVGENEIIDVTIKASEEEFEQLSESESFEFSWALYSPMFYARGIKFDKRKYLIVSDKNINDYEVSLYFMEHNDVNVNISLKDEGVLIVGWLMSLAKNTQ